MHAPLGQHTPQPLAHGRAEGRRELADGIGRRLGAQLPGGPERVGEDRRLADRELEIGVLADQLVDGSVIGAGGAGACEVLA